MTSRTRTIALVLASLLGLPRATHAQVVIPSMIGAWRGDAAVVSTWTRQKTLPVRIEIHADDRVTGTVGDATVLGARIMRNRGEEARTRRWTGEYSIEGSLTGPIVRVDNVWRTKVELVLDWRDDHFEGGLNTSGWIVAGIERRVLAARVVLRPVPVAIACEERD